jgi:hypothetical protein
MDGAVVSGAGAKDGNCGTRGPETASPGRDAKVVLGASVRVTAVVVPNGRSDGCVLGGDGGLDIGGEG